MRTFQPNVCCSTKARRPPLLLLLPTGYYIALVYFEQGKQGGGRLLDGSLIAWPDAV